MFKKQFPTFFSQKLAYNYSLCLYCTAIGLNKDRRVHQAQANDAITSSKVLCTLDFAGGFKVIR